MTIDPVTEIAKIDAWSPPNFSVMTDDVASGPKIIFVPSLEASISLLKTSWMNPKNFCPHGLLRRKIANRNCNASPHSTVRQGKSLRFWESAHAMAMNTTMPSTPMSLCSMAAKVEKPRVQCKG